MTWYLTWATRTTRAGARPSSLAGRAGEQDVVLEVDVLPQLGEMPWTRAVGVDVANFVVAWLRDHLAGRVAWAKHVNPRRAQRLVELLAAIGCEVAVEG